MLCAADVRALFVLQDRVSAERDNTYANTDLIHIYSQKAIENR